MAKAAYKPVSNTAFPNQTPADVKYADAKTNVEFGPKRDALDNAMSRIKEDSRYQTDVQKEMGGTFDKRLGEISQLLNQQLGQNTGRVQSTFEGASQRIGEAYQGARDASEGASEGVIDRLRREMNKLGLNAAAPATEELGQQQADNRARNAFAGAGAVGNITGLGAEFVAIHTKAESDSLQEWAGKREAFATRVQNAIMEINKDYNQSRNELLQQIVSLEGARGNAFAVNVMDTINARLERERQARMDALQAEIQRGQLAVARGQLGVARGGLSLSRQKHADAMRLAELERNKPTSYIDRLRHDAEVKELKDKIAGGSSDGRYQGLQGVHRYAAEELGNPGMANAYLAARAKVRADSMDGGSVEAHWNEWLQNTTPRMRQRYQALDAVYEGRWSDHSR